MPYILAFLAAAATVPGLLVFGWPGKVDWRLSLAVIYGWPYVPIFICLLLPSRRAPARALLRRPITWFIAIYFVSGLCTYFIAADRFNYDWCLDTKVRYFLVPWLIGSILANRPRDWLYAALGFLVGSLWATYYCISGVMVTHFHRPVGDFDMFHRNTLADTIDTAFLIALGLFLWVRPWRLKIPLVISMALNFVALAATQSRGGLLSLAVTSTILTTFAPGKRIKIIWPALIATTILGLLAVMPPEVLEERLNVKGGSAAMRPMYWDMAVKYIRDHPLQPLGWGQYPVNDANERLDNYCNWLIADYIQGGPVCAFASTAVVLAAIVMAYRNHMRLPLRSPAKAMNLIAILVIIQRYLHGSLECFWEVVWNNWIAFYFLGYLTFATTPERLSREEELFSPSHLQPPDGLPD